MKLSTKESIPEPGYYWIYAEGFQTGEPVILHIPVLVNGKPFMHSGTVHGPAYIDLPMVHYWEGPILGKPETPKGTQREEVYRDMALLNIAMSKWNFLLSGDKKL
jgi:hypothetical protein